MTPKFNLGFYEAWRMKGIFRQDRQWSAWNDRNVPIVTIWHTDLLHGISEVVEGDPPTIWCPPGIWASKPKAKGYLSLVRESMHTARLCEVILLAGLRSEDESASEVHAAAIDDRLYYAAFTMASDAGTLHGRFYTKEEGDSFNDCNFL